jgi:hypothetical protein
MLKVMSRLCLILTMVASQLACPLVCLSGAMPAARDSGAERKCNCCCRPPMVPAEHTPARQSGDCVCRGAVLAKDVQFDLDESSFARAGEQVSAAIAARETGQDWRAAVPDDGPARGRALRIALHSWQI